MINKKIRKKNILIKYLKKILIGMHLNFNIRKNRKIDKL